jgi:hypothetical protein
MGKRRGWFKYLVDKAERMKGQRSRPKSENFIYGPAPDGWFR